MKFKFDLQCHSATLPTNPSTSSASVGKDFLLDINIGTAASPTWQMVGGQRGASLSRKADSIDVSHKTSGGWKSKKAGLREWGVDLDGLVLLQDAGLQAMEQAFMDGKEINVRLRYPDGTDQQGWGSLTDFSMETPHDGEATIKGSIEGNGPLSARLAYSITPLTATMSLAATADKTFTISPSAAVITSVKTTDGTTLSSGTDYAYNTGQLVFKSTHLDDLTVGDHTYTIAVQDGNALTITITITA